MTDERCANTITVFNTPQPQRPGGIYGCDDCGN